CQTVPMEAFSKRELNSIRNNTIAEKRLEMTRPVLIYPNPVINNFLNIQFELKETALVGIALYDLNSKLIQAADAKSYEPGLHKQVLDLSTVPKGIYIINVSMPFKTYTQKIIKK